MLVIIDEKIDALHLPALPSPPTASLQETQKRQVRLRGKLRTKSRASAC